MKQKSQASSPGFITRKWRRLIQTYGPQQSKARQWNREFKEGHWDYLADTTSDRVYPILEKYAKGGGVLDMGCGLGNTPNEMAEGSYEVYLGIDISDEAVRIAQKRTQEKGRSHNTLFTQSDISTFMPHRKYRVILFRESIYYLRLSELKKMLKRYATYLDEGGVLMVTTYPGLKSVGKIEQIIADNFRLVEKHTLEPDGMLLVFR